MIACGCCCCCYWVGICSSHQHLALTTANCLSPLYFYLLLRRSCFYCSFYCSFCCFSGCVPVYPSANHPCMDWCFLHWRLLHPSAAAHRPNSYHSSITPSIIPSITPSIPLLLSMRLSTSALWQSRGIRNNQLDALLQQWQLMNLTQNCFV